MITVSLSLLFCIPLVGQNKNSYLNRFERLTVNLYRGQMRICGNVLYFWDCVPQKHVHIYRWVYISLVPERKGGMKILFPCYRWGIESPEASSKFYSYTSTTINNNY